MSSTKLDDARKRIPAHIDKKKFNDAALNRIMELSDEYTELLYLQAEITAKSKKAEVVLRQHVDLADKKLSMDETEGPKRGKQLLSLAGTTLLGYSLAEIVKVIQTNATDLNVGTFLLIVGLIVVGLVFSYVGMSNTQ